MFTFGAGNHIWKCRGKFEYPYCRHGRVQFDMFWKFVVAISSYMFQIIQVFVIMNNNKKFANYFEFD